MAMLLVAVLLLMFANGRFPLASCAWLGPLFLLRFTRGGRGLARLALAFLGLSFAFGFQFYDMTPLAGTAYYLFTVSFALTLVLPYVADRYLALRCQGLLRTLVFPLALVASEFLVSFGPFGSWGSVAYTQYEYLPLLQLPSVTGLYGITFLVGWFAATGNSIWEADFALARARRESAALALTLVAVLGGGEARLVFFSPSSPTLRVASITRPDLPPIDPDLNRRVMRGGPLSPEEMALLQRRSTMVADFLLDRAELEAQA
ncbi:MAG TPA: hypothetical protein VLT85_06520, partial [Terriglobales bacterium]|nr:hypothetical protein [Terriglobales bacterium]